MIIKGDMNMELKTAKGKAPHILICVMDHLTQRALDCYVPNEQSKMAVTPSIDALAEQGLVYDRIYCNTPLCQPSRASFWTGQYPHKTGTLSNGRKHQNLVVSSDMATLGEVFSEAGYRTVHFGKTHDNGALRGFTCADVLEKRDVPEPPEAFPEHYDSYQDYYTVERVVDWLKSADDQPSLVVADLNNPHDICGWIGHHNGLEGEVKHHEIDRPLPPLPDNFMTEDMNGRPLPIQYICCSHVRESQAARWKDETFRHYLAAFAHYVEKADESLRQILLALDESGRREDTIVVLMADHGDALAAHRLVTKQVAFYEESNRIPFIISGSLVKDRLGAGETRDQRLGSLLDLFPTLCDMAGVTQPDGLPGLSLFSEQSRERPFVVGQWHTEWGFTTSPGRMVRSQRYKYTHYLEGEGEELYDLENDPGEQVNLAHDPNHATILAEHRQMLRNYSQDERDEYFNLKVKVDPRWRSHAPGYENHVGSCAPLD